ncbi:uncharacterized protein LOC112081506 [Eutrema salsugineum]|uniref:uncharacterized protein LOC112081506 n=1 Tax=Eutrema salsugineum TaxID=72664 RepID=UPI000CED10B7|nr:uncharacterized protein LOC112081506 [Eutrema salsugineum]
MYRGAVVWLCNGQVLGLATKASLEYQQGDSSFVIESAQRLGNPQEMFCPCIDCRNLCHQSRETANEATPEFKTQNLFRSAFFDGEGSRQSGNDNEDQTAEVDSKEESEFRKKLADAETPLYSSCSNYTKVSAIMGLYRIKVKSGMSENYFDQLLTLVHDMLPGDNVLPTSTDDMKNFLKVFGFGYDVIHACKNDCILYRKQYENKVSCPRCNASRWERDKHTGEEKKGIPAKVLRYFPIKDRFKRMFRSTRMAESLQWHFNIASEDGTMQHPVDSITWALVNSKWPQFAAEPRNLRLGLSTDGMNPFSIQNTKYSTWPVLLVNYNMPPTMCMKAENIMLTMLIPGQLPQENFTLRAMLLWSISDYPALGTLAGCKVKGKQACNVCGKDTPFKWLKFSRKFVYMRNRKRLRPGHVYRHFENDFGRALPKTSKRKRPDLCENEDLEEEEPVEDTDIWRWKKRSIFFDLPYWKDMPVRHNIDVMHVEKNVSDALVSMLMQSAKSKDGLKARRDLEDMGIRRNLHVEQRGKRQYLPPAVYWLSKEEKKRFCKRLSKFRGPDGYAANIANCVTVEPPVIGALKSHDHHVLLHNLLSVAIRGLLPKGPRIAVIRLCNFFNRHMKKLKTYVKNYARPEACMAEGYLAGECIAFCLELLQASVPIQETINRNEDIAAADDIILEGRPLNKGEEVTLTDNERDIAHRYVLMNMAVMNPFVEQSNMSQKVKEPIRHSKRQQGTEPSPVLEVVSKKRKRATNPDALEASQRNGNDDQLPDTQDLGVAEDQNKDHGGDVSLPIQQELEEEEDQEDVNPPIQNQFEDVPQPIQEDHEDINPHIQEEQEDFSPHI